MPARLTQMTNAVQIGGLLHTTVCHRSTAEAVEQLVPFVEEGLRAHDDVVVNLTTERVAHLVAQLGDDAERVRWCDTHHWHPHPARRLRAIQELADDVACHGRGRLRFIGECAFSAGSPQLLAEWERFDAVLNHALVGAPISLVCTYDLQQLAPEVVERARCSHPHIGLLPPVENEDYLPPADYLAQRRGAPLPVPAEAVRLSGRPTPLDARALVHEVLGGAGIGRQKVDDMAVAVTEVVTNAWQAGARRVEVACWYVDGEAGVQVDDDGPGLRDPLAGYRRPAPSDERGRGLWIARQLADALDVWPHDCGTALRLRLFDAAP
jgi:anti-sigma regulatory factor (Ser/Thr protein kinase)